MNYIVIVFWALHTRYICMEMCILAHFLYRQIKLEQSDLKYWWLSLNREFLFDAIWLRYFNSIYSTCADATSLWGILVWTVLCHFMACHIFEKQEMAGLGEHVYIDPWIPFLRVLAFYFYSASFFMPLFFYSDIKEKGKNGPWPFI